VGCYGTADVPRTADGIAINKTELKQIGQPILKNEI